MNPPAHARTPALLALVLVLAGLLAACGPSPTRLAPGWDRPSNVNGVTGERVSGHQASRRRRDAPCGFRCGRLGARSGTLARCESSFSATPPRAPRSPPPSSRAATRSRCSAPAPSWLGGGCGCGRGSRAPSPWPPRPCSSAGAPVRGTARDRTRRPERETRRRLPQVPARSMAGRPRRLMPRRDWGWMRSRVPA